MDHSFTKSLVCLVALLQFANGTPVQLASETNQENVPPVIEENVQNLPQQALLIVVAAPCVPEQPLSQGNEGNAGPIGVIPINNLEQLLLINQLIQELNQQKPNAGNTRDLNGGILSSGLLGSLTAGGTGGVSASNLYGGGSLLNGGILGSGLIGNMVNTGSSTSGSGILGLIPLNLGNLGGTNGGLGIFNLGLGSGSGSGLMSPGLLSSLTSGNNPLSTILSNLNLSGSGPGLGTGIFGTNLFSTLGLSGTSPTNPITTILGNIGLSPGLISGSSNTGGLSGFLGGLGVSGGGIPTGTTGILGLLGNLGMGTTGPLAFLNTLFGGTTARTMTGNFRRYYGRDLDAKEDVDEMPWLVRVLVDGVAVADGVLVSDRHVLTAAAPLIGALDASLLVTLGHKDRCSEDPEAFNMTISQIMKNPLFDPETRAHDLTLLRLSSKVSVGPQLRPICLPSILTPYLVYEATVASYAEDPTSATGSLCKPKQALLPLQPIATCASATSPAALITEDKTCLGVLGAKENMCSAEPGTAVQYRAKDGSFELIGIMSHSRVCGSSNSTLFVRVHDHLPWILDNIHQDMLCIKI